MDVTTVSVDSLCDARRLRPSAVKIDVEGAELEQWRQHRQPHLRVLHGLHGRSQRGSGGGMTPDTQKVVLAAFDEALAQRVVSLCGVLFSSSPGDEQAMERFLNGLSKAVGLHEQVVTIFNEGGQDGRGA